VAGPFVLQLGARLGHVGICHRGEPGGVIGGVRALGSADTARGTAVPRHNVEEGALPTARAGLEGGGTRGWAVAVERSAEGSAVVRLLFARFR